MNTVRRLRVRDAVGGPGSGSRAAVWFFPSDYAGLWRRLAIELADLIAIVILMTGIAAAAIVLHPAERPDDRMLAALWLCWLACIYGYFVVLKRSRISTLGYRLARVRIVDPYGRPPDLEALTLRLLFGLAGPLNIVLDALWIPFNRHRQALRDRLAHTYVVKASAEPAGAARVVTRTYSVLGLSFAFEDIEPIAMGPLER